MSNNLYLLVDEYMKRLGRNKSEHTIRSYGSSITRFVDWVVEKDYTQENLEISQDLCLDYIDILKAKYAPKSTHAHMTAIYGWMTFLHSKGIITELPFFSTKEMNEYLPVTQKSEVRVLTTEEVKGLVGSCDSLLKECLVRTFYDTGMRVSELVRAKWNDLAHANGRTTLTVFGKGRGGMTKKRTVRISEATLEKLNELKEHIGVETEYLFISERTKKPFTERRIDQIIRAAGDAYGIEELSTHTFRKSVATHLIENNMAVEYVSKYLGHSSITTTIENYVNLDNSIMDKVDEFHVNI